MQLNRPNRNWILPTFKPDQFKQQKVGFKEQKQKWAKMKPLNIVSLIEEKTMIDK